MRMIFHLIQFNMYMTLPGLGPPPSHYPSMEASDDKDKDGEVQDGDEPDLERFMDW
jgi:hypothetical protein